MNEITYNWNLRVIKGNLNAGSNEQAQSTLNGTGHVSHAVQDIPTTTGGTALAVTGIGTPGYAWFNNLDLTNFVTVGHQVSGTYYPILKLKAGESGMIRLATTSLYALADTATVSLEFGIFED